MNGGRDGRIQPSGHVIRSGHYFSLLDEVAPRSTGRGRLTALGRTGMISTFRNGNAMKRTSREAPQNARDARRAIPAFNVPYLPMLEPTIAALRDARPFGFIEVARLEWEKFEAKSLRASAMVPSISCARVGLTSRLTYPSNPLVWS